jgi:hypothetical protein
MPNHCGRRRLTALVTCILILSIGIAANAATSPTEFGKECGGCHAIPPGSGQDHGPFKPGAHAAHAALACQQCHPTVSDHSHINGVVSLNPGLEYQYGNAVPWPTLGSGSCGGLGFPFQPSGCHERMPNAKCNWLPGKSCTPVERR